MSARAFFVLDDDPAERRIMMHLLGDAFPSAVLEETGDAGRAMAACCERTFDCVLLDYNMPQMDGVAFAAELRARQPHLPLVLVTGAGDEMLVAEAMRNGVTDYIPKSRINAESIQRTVERAMQTCAQTRIIEEQRGELESFAYALAHDFKQPIRQIRTFSQFLTAEVDPGENAIVHKHLSYLDQAARRLANLVDVMSQYTLLQQAPELGPTRVAAVLADTRAALSGLVQERDAEITVECADIVVRGNETLLAQVLQNLIVNGLKYNKSAVPCIAISVTTERQTCVIAVRDNGIGIEPQYLAEIFKPLIRLHAHSEYEGSGLGLTLARKAMLAQGGSIACNSEPGVGSTFLLRLPLASPG
ncbi:MAG TPA: ATP-binding protein [Caulobacterales bacterium]|nr:ATP-binding protein [Caulobacterales bacterium]